MKPNIVPEENSFDPRPTLRPILVPMGTFAVVREENTLLYTSPLGAGIAVAIYDPVTKVAGLLHSMLPDSRINRGLAKARPGLFLETGVTGLLEEAFRLKAQKENLVIYVAGGALILDPSAYFNVGLRNYEILKSTLAERGLAIHAEDVGGQVNRSLHLNTARGEVRTQITGQPEEQLLCKR